MRKTGFFTGSSHHHHGHEAVIKAASRIAAAHRTVDLRGVDAANATRRSAANSVAHVLQSYKLIHGRMTLDDMFCHENCIFPCVCIIILLRHLPPYLTTVTNIARSGIPIGVHCVAVGVVAHE